MGLDVIVHRGLKLQPKDSQNFSFVAFVIDEKWSDRIKKLVPDGKYLSKQKERVMSYPCSTHNDFRRELCKMLGYKEHEWHSTELPVDTPFYEFFEFADNSGCMDWATCAELYIDFIDYQHEFRKHLKAMESQPIAEMYKDIYAGWLKAFKQARNKGVIQYN